MPTLPLGDILKTLCNATEGEAGAFWSSVKIRTNFSEEFFGFRIGEG